MSFKKSIQHCLSESKKKFSSVEEQLLTETTRILNNELFTEKNILSNLGQYINLDELVVEEEVDAQLIFTAKEIKTTAINYRLKFLDSKFYKKEIDYKGVLKIKDFNKIHKKELKHFKILSFPQSFINASENQAAALFAKTNHHNYYLIHQWGEEIQNKRKLICWPLRTFETLVLSILAFTILEALILPTKLITLDAHAQYWSGYRGGTFFHLLIFNSGFTTYFVLTFAKNFSCNLWNRKNDFD